MTRYFYDCEFIEDGVTIDLISIGIAADDGREYYAVSSEFNIAKLHANPFLEQNVWPYLPQKTTRHWLLDESHPDVRTRAQIRRDVLGFLAHGGSEPELWARWGAYDHVVLMWLFGDMTAHPPGLPYYTRDLQQRIDELQKILSREIKLPDQELNEHHALADARHNLAVAVALDELQATL